LEEAAMKFQRKELDPAGFQMAPMIDIVFLLLSFFIITWQWSRNETELDVSVPTTAEGADATRTSAGEKIINIRADGTVVVDRTALTLDELFGKMKNLAALYKNQPIRLRADSKTEYQYVIDVISTCTKAGIWNISFATQKPQPENSQ
jgi:biopolymer transport protein ExbD